MPDSHLVSFVLRFVTPPEGEAEGALPWRGLIRHVQSDAEQHFRHWAEAVAFIEQFVTLDGAEEGTGGDEQG